MRDLLRQKEGPMDNTAKLMRAASRQDRHRPHRRAAGFQRLARQVRSSNWDFDVTMGSFSTGPDPAIGTERLYICRNIEPLFARNASGYCNPKLDEIFGAAARGARRGQARRRSITRRRRSSSRTSRISGCGTAIPDRLQREADRLAGRADADTVPTTWSAGPSSRRDPARRRRLFRPLPVDSGRE